MANDTHQITLTPELMKKLRAQVQLTDTTAINTFLLDAITSYLQLGKLHMRGGTFLFQPNGQDTPVKLHFPFSPVEREEG